MNILADVAERLPSILAEVLPEIANKILESELGETGDYIIPFEIEEKIEFNNVTKYRELLKELGVYIQPIDQYLAALNTNNPGKKSRFMKKIRTMYIETLARLND